MTRELIMALMMALIAAPIVEAVFDLSTRLARKLVTWSAHRIYANDPERAATRAREWETGIEHTPKYLALGQALMFTGVAIGKGAAARGRVVSRAVDRVPLSTVVIASASFVFGSFLPFLIKWHQWALLSIALALVAGITAAGLARSAWRRRRRDHLLEKIKLRAGLVSPGGVTPEPGVRANRTHR